jgi:hypothetical protein
MKNLLLMLVLLTSLSGCLMPDDIWADGPYNDPVIFQSEYTNYAWGYNHGGWMLDNTGQVKRFQKSTKWIFTDSLGYISAVDMYKNINACDSVIAQISSKDFKTNNEKALTCLDGSMTKPQNTMADAGEHIDAFYVYEPGHNRYKRIILNMTGDWSQENLAPNAKEVVEWMKLIK